MNHVREVFYRRATYVIVSEGKSEIVFLEEIKMFVNGIIKTLSKTGFTRIVKIYSLLNVVKGLWLNVKREFLGILCLTSSPLARNPVGPSQSVICAFLYPRYRPSPFVW